MINLFVDMFRCNKGVINIGILRKGPFDSFGFEGRVREESLQYQRQNIGREFLYPETILPLHRRDMIQIRQS